MMVKRHQKAGRRATREGGIIAKEAPIARLQRRASRSQGRQADAGRVQVPRGWPQGALRQALRRDHRSLSEVEMARLLEHYREVVVPQLQRGVRLQEPDAGAAAREDRHQHGGRRRRQRTRRSSTNATAELTKLSGQKPAICRARRSVANFKLREGMPIGCKVTLRRQRMYEFLDRLINIALPRVRDFRGVSPKSFDGRGNYALRREGADHLPGDQLRRRRGDAGHGHHHLHDGARPTRRPRRFSPASTCRSGSDGARLATWRRRAPSRRTTAVASWWTVSPPSAPALKAVVMDQERDPEERFEATLQAGRAAAQRRQGPDPQPLHR